MCLPYRIIQGMWGYRLSSNQIMYKVRLGPNGQSTVGFIVFDKRPQNPTHHGRTLQNPGLGN
eukprot:580239-Ditylum_brightwellii.AAC.1